MTRNEKEIYLMCVRNQVLDMLHDCNFNEVKSNALKGLMNEIILKKRYSAKTFFDFASLCRRARDWLKKYPSHANFCNFKADEVEKLA